MEVKDERCYVSRHDHNNELGLKSQKNESLHQKFKLVE